jgi:hypothetical protein
MTKTECLAFRAWLASHFTAAWLFSFEVELADVWGAAYPTASTPSLSYRERLNRAEAMSLRIRKRQLAAFRKRGASYPPRASSSSERRCAWGRRSARPTSRRRRTPGCKRL